MAESNKNIIRRRLIKSYATSVISIAMVLFLLAASAIFTVNAANIGNYFKENMSFSVFFKQSTTEKEAASFSDRIRKRDFVKDCRYISKEEGEKEMETLLGEDFLEVFESSPIPISLELHLNAGVVTRDSLETIKKDVLSDPLVEDVVYQANMVEALNANLKKVTEVIAVVAIILLAISFALISNTVRLNIHTRRFTIHTMSLVGAKRSFIARPFVLRAILQGFVASLLADGVLLLVISRIREKSELLSLVMNPEATRIVLICTILAGILICVISTAVVVSKMAYISKDDLYY
ncbi:MAG: permease-like cell division protein FtsX [Bacteroidales bacterium]|nr:permease-like cell division protein FtsX [Candidatus Cacconaster scatequi]